MLAGVIRAQRSGKGAYIDVSQYECGVLFMAAAMHDYFSTGHVAERCGNNSRDAAPHGAFACRDGEWLALSCWSDREFAALARMLGQPALAEKRFATLAARQANAAELDERISCWTRKRAAARAAEVLQAIGIAAYPVVEVAGLFHDPQLLARRHWRVRRHPEMGAQSYCLPGFDLEESPGDIVSAAPCLGADNDFVFSRTRRPERSRNAVLCGQRYLRLAAIAEFSAAEFMTAGTVECSDRTEMGGERPLRWIGPIHAA